MSFQTINDDFDLLKTLIASLNLDSESNEKFEKLIYNLENEVGMLEDKHDEFRSNIEDLEEELNSVKGDLEEALNEISELKDEDE